MILSKVCTVCKQDKPFESFYNSKTSSDGKTYRCKSCDNLARNKYRQNNYERHLKLQRERNWKFRYGITRDDFNLMWSSQKGLCKICEVPLTNIEIDGDTRNKSNTCVVDHEHDTFFVRGLLCSRCNKGLGLFDDSVEKLEKACKYLINANIEYSEIHKGATK